MDEDITIINTETRNEKIKTFFIKNKKILFFILVFFVLIIVGFFSNKIYKENQKLSLSDKYNKAVIEYGNGNKLKVISSLKEVIEKNDSTYSPLALYFLIDNNLIENKKEVNDFFDVVIKNNSLEKEIKNLIIYKKALYNADFIDENELLDILNPLINSQSVWKSHALYLVAEYFYSKNEKQKSKEFFNQILVLENANQDLLIESQKRLNRDLSD